MRGALLDLDELDGAIAERTETAFSFLERLVAVPSTVGDEHEAQVIVEQELKRLGFEVERLSIPDGIGDDPLAGVPQTSYAGRYDVVGRLGAGVAPSLLLNGHVAVVGRSAHAESADRAVNPVDLAFRIVERLRELERDMNAHVEPAMDGVAHPYNVNIGTFRSGDWPSSVPAGATMGVRIGHPSGWSAREAESRVRSAIARAGDHEPWLRDHPPAIRASGFRAQGYALASDDPLAQRVAAAHEAAHGRRPVATPMASTTDARLYLNGFDVPALCYGPTAHDIHGIDESVELSSIVDGARTLARFIATWYTDPPGGR